MKSAIKFIFLVMLLYVVASAIILFIAFITGHSLNEPSFYKMFASAGVLLLIGTSAVAGKFGRSNSKNEV